MKEIQATEEETTEEQREIYEITLITLDVGELLVIRRSLHVKEANSLKILLCKGSFDLMHKERNFLGTKVALRPLA